MIQKLLFVCTGNTCRSPMIEGYCRDQITKKQLPLEVRSAGICDDGNPVSEHAVTAMKEIGIDISEHTSTRLTPALCGWADRLYVMDRRHFDLLKMLGISEEKIEILDIFNPWHKDLEAYRQARDLLIQKAETLLPSVYLEDLSPDTLKEATALHASTITPPWSETAMEAELHKDTAVFRVAKDSSGHIVGLCGMYTVMEDADIACIAVSEQLRRQKIGTLLLSDAQKQAKNAGCLKLMLEVRASNTAARSLYDSFGFSEDGVRPRYYTQPTEDAVLYSKFLEEEVLS